MSMLEASRIEQKQYRRSMLLPEGDEGVKIPQLNSPLIISFSFSGDKLRSDLRAGCLPCHGRGLLMEDSAEARGGS